LGLFWFIVLTSDKANEKQQEVDKKTVIFHLSPFIKQVESPNPYRFFVPKYLSLRYDEARPNADSALDLPTRNGGFLHAEAHSHALVDVLATWFASYRNGFLVIMLPCGHNRVLFIKFNRFSQRNS
jgi:hypothetical protein